MPGKNATPSFLIRTASIQDLESLTELHCASFKPEEHIPVMLGRDYVRATYRWLITSSQSYCLVANADYKIIGLVSVCDRAFTRPMFLACLPEFMQSLLRTPRLIFEKRLWSRLIRRPETSNSMKHIVDYPGLAQLIVIVVAADCRGTGVFGALADAAKAHSKERGSVAIRAGVYKFNQTSRRAFAKNGWMEIPELETNDTVFYVSYLDPELPQRLGVAFPHSPS